ERAQRADETETGLYSFDTVEQRYRPPLLGGSSRDRRGLEVRIDRTIDVLDIAQRFQHAQIVSKVPDPCHQAISSFKFEVFFGEMPFHRLAAVVSISNWSRIRITI